MPFLKVDFDIRSIEREFDSYSTVMQKAVVNSLNVVGRKANTAASKHITTEFNIKKPSIKPLVTLKLANFRARRGSFTIIVKVKGRGLFKFGAHETKAGVTVSVRKSARNIKGAFIAPWRTGGTDKFVFRRDKKLGVVQRNYRGKRFKSFKRRMLFGPSVAGLYGSRKVRKIMTDVINKNYQEVLDKKFNDQFEKRR